MSGAQIIEFSSSSSKGIEDAVQSGLKKVAETVKNVQGAWVSETKVVTDTKGHIKEWRVTLRVTFIVD